MSSIEASHSLRASATSRKGAKARRCLTLAAAFLFASAQPGFAQSSAGITDIIVTGRALPEAKGDAAYDIVTIDRERIDASASNRIEDVLKDVAGLTQFRRTDARSANATSQGATLRGLGGSASSRALLVLDGVPQSDPFGGWVTWPAYATNRIGEVRVTRGGGSGVYGSGALAGTIEFESIGSGRSGGSVAYGSRDSIDVDAIVAGTLGGGFAFISANYARSDGFTPIVASQRGPADIAAPYEQASIAARAVVPAGPDTEIQTSVLGFRDRRTRGTMLSQNGGDGADASLRIVHRGRWQAQALAYVQAREFRSRFVSIDAARATVLQTTDQFNVPSTGIGARFEVRPPLGKNVELRLGGDWRRTAGETNDFFTYVNALPTRLREAGGSNETLGGFAEASATLGNLTLTGGARIDRWTIANGRLVERTIATGGFIRNEIAPDRDGWEPTARAGLAYRAGPVTVRSAAYLGWRLPTLNELYRPFRVGADATAANPALSPERMRGAEIGLDWQATEGVTIRANAFSNRLVRPIANVTLGAGPGQFPGVGFVAAGGSFRQRQNVDAIASQGIEIDARWQSRKWQVQVGYGYTDARVRASGAALPLDGLRPAQVPKHTASATLGWSGLSGTLRYVAAQFEDDLNRRKLDDAITLDAVAEFPISSSLAVSVRGENLFDTRVEAAISGNGIVERASPRTLWIGVKLRSGN
jgi:vitamin B12 transporter